MEIDSNAEMITKEKATLLLTQWRGLESNDLSSYHEEEGKEVKQVQAGDSCSQEADAYA